MIRIKNDNIRLENKLNEIKSCYERGEMRKEAEKQKKYLNNLLNRPKSIPYAPQLNFLRKYKLIGVITHLGESGASGHFIAHCLSPADKKWYTYNDDIVSECVDFKKNIIDLGMPYLLFYQRIDTINVQNNNNNNIQNNNGNNIQGK